MDLKSAVHHGAVQDAAQSRTAVAIALPGVLFGVRVWASVSLALLVAYWLQLDNAYWAGTSASIVAQPGLGASLRKGRFRAIGTVVGAVAIVTLTALFPQNHLALLASLTLWGALCGFFASVLPNFAGYGAALAGYTAAIIFSNIVPRPEDVFTVAVTRTLEISIGIFAAGVIHALTDFGDARRRLERALAGIAAGIAKGLTQMLATGGETPTLRLSRRELIGQIIAVDATIDEAIGEPSHLRYHPGELRAAEEALFTALSSWRGIANHLEASAAPGTNALCAALLPAVAEVATSHWLRDPQQARRLCASNSRRAAAIYGDNPSAHTPAAQLLIHGVAATLSALERVANALVLVVKSSNARPDRSARRLRIPDPAPPLLNALRVAAGLATAEVFWIATEWNDGPSMITFTAIAITLFSPRAELAYPTVVDYAAGTAAAGAVAVVLNQAILPALHGGFLSESWVLACVLVPFGALAAVSPWHKTAFAAVVMNLIPILALENDPIYDGTRVVNTAVAISAGTVVAAVFMRLIPPLSPATRVRRLLALTLRDLRQMLKGRRRFTRDRWIALVSQRLAALPLQASFDEQTQLLAALSVGEASIVLASYTGSPGGDEIDQAFARLADGDIAAARAALTHFCSARVQAAASYRAPDVFVIEATLICDALARHPEYFKYAG